MLISEIYLSRQGEGQLSGIPSVFVRTSGCNLRCDFCDTPFTSWHPEGRLWSIDEIVDAVQQAALMELPPRIDTSEAKQQTAAAHVVLTGGEPMIARDVELLCDRLAGKGFHITIETAATVDKMVHCDLISISPKLSNSTPSKERAGRWSEKHDATRFRPEVAAALISRHNWQLKYVVESPDDLPEIEHYLAAVEAESCELTLDRSRVLLMPEGVDAETLARRECWLVPICESKGFTFCQRQHIFWYGNKRAT